MKQTLSMTPKLLFLFVLLYVIASVVTTEAKGCNSGVKIRGKEGDCLVGPASQNIRATLTLNSFEEGGDGGGPSECDGQYHSDDTLIVALSTGWFNNMKRCHHFITIQGNGRSVQAKVVDECDSRRGCRNDVVDASKAVWKALGVNENEDKWGWMDVTWSDA